jgi:hypothetical protein
MMGFAKKIVGGEFGFLNPIITLLQRLVRDCGLLFAHDTTVVDNGIIHDKVSKAVRPSYLGRELVGNGLMYGDTTIVPTQNTKLTIWGNFNSLTVPSQLQRMGCRNGFEDAEFRFGLENGSWYSSFGDVTRTEAGADILSHKFELSKDGFFIDNIQIENFTGAVFGVASNSIQLLAYNNGLLPSNFTMDRCEIEENGELIFLLDNFQEVQDTADTSQAKIYDATGNYAMQLFNTHVNYVQENIDIDSTADNHGVKVAQALGKNLFDKSVADVGFRVSTVSGNLLVDATAYTTDFIYVEEGQVITMHLDAGEQSYAYYDSDKSIVSGGFTQSLPITVPSGIMYYKKSFKIANTDIDALQLELGSTATAYESYQGLYKDALLTEPYSDGQLVLPLYANGVYTSQARAFVDGGARYVLTGNEFREVEKALRVVDGVVDTLNDRWENVLFNGTVNATRATMEMDYYADLIGSMTTYWDDSIYNVEYEEYDVSKAILNTSGTLTVSGNTQILDVNTVFVRFSIRRKDFGVIDLEEVKVSDLAVYVGNPIPLPTPGQAVVGNSYILRYPYPKIAQADTNRILTEADGTPKLLAVADAVDNVLNQYFTKTDPDLLKTTFYAEPLTGDCLIKANKYMV